MSHLLQQILALGIVAVVLGVYVASRLRARRRSPGGGCGCAAKDGCAAGNRTPAGPTHKRR